MTKLTKEQIKRLESTASMFSSIQLMCDGYKITLKERLIKRKLRVLLCVNDKLEGSWIVNPQLHAESKFYMPLVRYIKTSPRSKKKEKLDIGIRQYDFASVGQVLRHLNKVCDSVEIYEEKSND